MGVSPRVSRVRKFWKFLPALIIILIIVAAIIIVVRKKGQKPPSARQGSIAVKLGKPQIMPMTEELSYNGNIAAIQQAIILPEVSGALKKVLVDIGDSVKTNQLLAVIDSSVLYQTMISAQASYHNASASYQRSRELFDQIGRAHV